MKILTMREARHAWDRLEMNEWAATKVATYSNALYDSHEDLRRLLEFAWWLVADEGREQVDADIRQTILDAIGDES